jgi:hypothetical protein
MRGSQDKWKPSITEGTLGTHHSHATPANAPGVTSSEAADDERGPTSRYSNPPGFFGLYGNQTGKDAFEKTGGLREVKLRTGGHGAGHPRLSAVPRAPFNGRRNGYKGGS